VARDEPLHVARDPGHSTELYRLRAWLTERLLTGGSENAAYSSYFRLGAETALLLCSLLLAVATPALATDGVLEINHTCAAGPGCFSGDGAVTP